MDKPQPPPRTTQRLAGVLTERLGSEPLLPSTDWRPGSLIADRYEIMQEIGRGGEAVVYLCQDALAGNRRVVCKIYRLNVEHDPEVMEKLLGLEHPDILQILDYGRVGDCAYEVSEYAEGGSLKGKTIDESTLSTTIIPEILSALRHCHEAGIVHRDLSPANLFFRRKEHLDVVVGDFGLSSSVMAGGSLYKSSRIGFTMDYGAPELYQAPAGWSGGQEDEAFQIFGKEVDYYAFGIILIELILGHPVFVDDRGVPWPPQGVYWAKQQGEVPLPQGVSDRFRTLLRGLTHPMRRRRWSAEHVDRWLHKENVEVETIERVHPEWTYKLGPHLEAHGRSELASLMQAHPDAARQHVGEGLVERALERLDQDLALKVRNIHRAAPNLDAAVIEIIHTLDPGLPYLLAPGHEARTPEALARLIDVDAASWAVGREHLIAGRLTAWLRATGYVRLQQAWNKEAARFAGKENADAGLECFLHVLDPELPLPSLRFEPAGLDLGHVGFGAKTSVTVHVVNPGRGHLAGAIESPAAESGVSVSPVLFRGARTAVEVMVDASELSSGRFYAHNLPITSNSGKRISIPVRFRVVFPWGRAARLMLPWVAGGFATLAGFRYLMGQMIGLPASMWVYEYPGSLDSGDLAFGTLLLTAGLGGAIALGLRLVHRLTRKEG